MNNKGMALGVTLIYIVIVSFLCAAALYFGMNHYKAVRRRVDRMQKFYSAEGGIYLGIMSGYRGTAAIGDNNITVSAPSELRAQSDQYREF